MTLPEVHAAEPTRRRNLCKTRIEYADPTPEDAFAPAPSGCRCRDRAGRLRKRHEWDSDERCVWCSQPNPMVRF